MFAIFDIIGLVIKMQSLNDMVVTDIKRAIVVHFEKGQRFQMKNRAHYGLSLCVNGQITYTMNGKTYVSNQNNAVLLPQGGTYSLYGDKEGLFPLVDFKCERFHSDEIVVIPLKNPQACITEFETLKRLFPGNENRLKTYSTFYGLLSEVVSKTAGVYSPLRSVMQYIEQHVSDSELSNTKLAQNMGISEVYLRKLFTAHQNCTPKQYILTVRIQKAKQMLVDTTYTVSTIAEECGFGSLYHFCRAFKERTGLTPTQYAAQNRVFKL